MFQNKKLFLKVCFVMILLAIATSPVLAQQAEYSLGLNKIIGYSSGDQIRGSMNMYVIGPADNIQSVKYVIDGKVVATVTQAPFNVSFQTSAFEFGYHDLSATIQTKDRRTVDTAIRKFNFATPQQEQSNLINILGPILGIVVLIMVLGFASQMLLFRNKFKSMPAGTRREYGLRGGTICPKCSRPYALHWWALNLMSFRLDRCDFCGKWGFVRRHSSEELRAAEQREIQSFGTSEPIVQKSEQEKLKEMLDKSKYSE
jgi:Zn ribbon nucleic-acid-binding protein